jgi:hypothetical protein
LIVARLCRFRFAGDLIGDGAQRFEIGHVERQ